MTENPPTLHYEAFGSGNRAVVAIHGWNGGANVFSELGNTTESLTIYAIDLPGFGDSPAPEKWELNDIHRTIFNTIRKLPADDFTVVGACSGFYFATVIADEFTENVKHLIGLEPFAWLPWYLKLFLIPIGGPMAYRTAFDSILGRKIGEWFLNGDDDQTDMLHSFAESDATIPYRYLELFRDLDVSSLPSVAGIPKHLFFAEDTFGVVRRGKRHWRDKWPDVDQQTLENTTHLLLQDHPDKVAHAISKENSI